MVDTWGMAEIAGVQNAGAMAQEDVVDDSADDSDDDAAAYHGVLRPTFRNSLKVVTNQHLCLASTTALMLLILKIKSSLSWGRTCNQSHILGCATGPLSC